MGMHVAWVGNQLQPNTDIAEMRNLFREYLIKKCGKDVPSKYILVSQKIPFYTAKSEESYKDLLAEVETVNPPTLYLGHFEKASNQLKLKRWKEYELNKPDELEKLFKQNDESSDSRYFLRISSFDGWELP